jgi:hypothetical protein
LASLRGAAGARMRVRAAGVFGRGVKYLGPRLIGHGSQRSHAR